MAVRIYVGVVAAAAAALGVLAAGVGAAASPPPAALAVFTIAVAVAELLQVRYVTSRGVDALNLIEGALAPLLLVGSGTEVVVVTAAGIAAASIIGRNQPLKAVFNVSQWVVAVACGVLVLDASRERGITGAASVGALTLTVILVSLMNQITFLGVLKAAGRRTPTEEARQDGHAVVVSHVSSILANVTA